MRSCDEAVTSIVLGRVEPGRPLDFDDVNNLLGSVKRATKGISERRCRKGKMSLAVPESTIGNLSCQSIRRLRLPCPRIRPLVLAMASSHCIHGILEKRYENLQNRKKIQS